MDSYCVAVFAGQTAAGFATLCSAIGIVLMCRRPTGAARRAAVTLWTVVILAIAGSIVCAQFLSTCGPQAAVE